MRFLKNLFSLCFLIIVVCSCAKNHKTIRTSQVTQTFAYVGSTYWLYTCNINEQTGKFNGCQDSGFTAFAISNNISYGYTTAALFTTTESQTYAYVTNNKTQVYQCLVDSLTGLFTECTLSGATFSTPWGIAINTAQNGNTYAYIRTSSGADVSQCAINSTTGQLSACQTITGFSGDTPSIVFNSIGGNTYAYMPDASHGIWRCTVTAAGGFANCQDQTISILGYAEGIAFASIENQVFAYIADYDNPYISQCAVSVVDGSLFNCSPSLGNYYSLGIAGNQGFIYVQYGYDTELIGFLGCTVNTTGALNNCSDSGMSLFFYNDDDATTINFATLTGTQRF